MSMVYSQAEKKWTKVKNLKNLLFWQQPDYQFFLHRCIDSSHFAVTEKTTGCAVTFIGDTAKEAIIRADIALASVTPEQFKVKVNEAFARQRNDINQL